MSANPSVIINDSTSDRWKKRWRDWPQITAVKKNHLFGINPDFIERAGPRLLQGANQVCEYLELR